MSSITSHGTGNVPLTSVLNSLQQNNNTNNQTTRSFPTSLAPLEVIDLDAEDTSPTISPPQNLPDVHQKNDAQQFQSFPISAIENPSNDYHNESHSSDHSTITERQKKKPRITPLHLVSLNSLSQPKPDDGGSSDSVNSIPTTNLKVNETAQPSQQPIAQPQPISDLIELSSDDDDNDSDTPMRPAPQPTQRESYQQISTPPQQNIPSTQNPTNSSNNSVGRLLVSHGGNLFRMENDNSIQILDSDDEDEMTASHNIINDGNGMLALASNISHPNATTPSSNPLTSFTQTEAPPFGALVGNRVANQPGVLRTGNINILNTPQDIGASHALPTFYNQTLPHNLPHQISNLRVENPWTNFPAVPSSTQLQSQPSQDEVQGVHFDTGPGFSTNMQQPYNQTQNDQLALNSNYENQTNDVNFTPQTSNDFPPLPFPNQSDILAEIDQAFGFGNDPTPIESNTVPLPVTTETVSQGTSVRDRNEEDPGLSQTRLRNLLRQNELTADATVEADSPQELTVTLMPHQKRALAWMRKREEPADSEEELVAVDDECLGGILADDQGLGKTLSMIALTVTSIQSCSQSKKQSEKDSDEESLADNASVDEATESSPEVICRKRQRRRPRPQTLIVCPVSLINQWKEEFRSKVKPRYRPTVLIYHGPKRTKYADTLKNYDIVITTYSILKNEYPKILTDHKEYQLRKEAKLKLPTRDPGPPFQIKWDRIVLDEAQYIKNRKTTSWKAAAALNSKRRWCLTGTPIQNSVDDIFSLFCFIQYEFVPSVEVWNTRWKRKLEHPSAQIRERAFRRFQTVTGVVLLRRTKKDEINGKPLINLPARISNILEKAFEDEEEQKVYQAVQEKTVIQVNKFLLEGSLHTNYSSVLLLLLRLRQACSHPFLIQYTQLTGTKYLTAAGLLDTYDSPYTADDLEEAMELVESGYSNLDNIEEASRERFEKMFEPSMKGKKVRKTIIKCDSCSETQSAIGIVITRCGHLFCKKCQRTCKETKQCTQCHTALPDPEDEEPFWPGDDVRKEVHAKVILGDESRRNKSISASEIRACMRDELQRRMSQKRKENELKTENAIISEEKGDISSCTPEGSLDINEPKTGSATDDEKLNSKSGAKENLLRAISQHSTKIRAVINQLEDTRKDDPKAKTIIFSQWTSMLDILEFHVQLNGHKACRLDGSMQLGVRQQQLEDFKSNDEKNVMLISLHAGGTGLNLTEATNVILTDVWWNPSVEEQAIDRAHRIGQTKAVNVHRIKMIGTVEEKIYTICERKREIIDGSLGVTGAQSLGRKKLTIHELMEMFGSAAENVARNAEAGTAAAEAASNILRHAQ